MSKGYTQTLMGRYRQLGRYFQKEGQKGWISFGLRASINTPIQGGAADIVIAAMVKIAQNKRIRALGWKLLLQIHDELILEGPEETSEEALGIVKACMEQPLQQRLLVDLEVDAKLVDNWLEGK